MPTLNSQSGKSDSRFVMVMFLSFALGMVVALVVYFLWRSQPAGLQHWSVAAALAVCPPFVLTYAIGRTPESDFALVLGVGTIILANAFLYAGAAAGIYAVVTMLSKKKG